MKAFFRMLIFEYVTNHIINKIPCCKIRWAFYRFILRENLSSKAYIMLGQYIYHDSHANLTIGDFSVVNRNCILDSRGGLFIGNNVNISSEVAFYTGGHEINSPDFKYYAKPICIEDYVWIGTRAMIMPGVTVGKGAMVMPGAIVTKDVESYTIAAGTPAKSIGNRTEDLTYTLTWRSMFL